MGKPTGFMEYNRKDDMTIPVKERIKNFNEFHTMLSPDERHRQSARCMDCGVPMCQSAIRLKGMVTGCPLHNMIPEWNDEIYHGHERHALDRLCKTSSFPEFTGRVCPALCEKACICGEAAGDSVTIHNNELYLIETAFTNGWMQPRIPASRSGKHIAVIGSGPSGLAAADLLNRRGHSVTVYERDDRVGGLLMYGIPNMKLDKSVIERRRKLMEEEGVTFLCGQDVGQNVNAQDILSEYDAVILACGAKKARSLDSSFHEHKEVRYAVDFLTETTKKLLSANETVLPVEQCTARGLDVVIVGGGDTGNDCVGTCIRQGAKSVTQLEMMAAPPVNRSADNPWPEWPKVLKTDYGQEEAIVLFGHDPRIYETTVKELLCDRKTGKLTAIRTVKVCFKDRKLTEIPGTEQELPCQLLLVAAGFTGCEDYTAKAFGVDLSARGVVATEEDHYHTNVDKVFTAGDMHRGQSLVVWAIAEGRAAAREVDEYLMGYTEL